MRRAVEPRVGRCWPVTRRCPSPTPASRRSRRRLDVPRQPVGRWRRGRSSGAGACRACGGARRAIGGGQAAPASDPSIRPGLVDQPQRLLLDPRGMPRASHSRRGPRRTTRSGAPTTVTRSLPGASTPSTSTRARESPRQVPTEVGSSFPQNQRTRALKSAVKTAAPLVALEPPGGPADADVAEVLREQHAAMRRRVEPQLDDRGRVTRTSRCPTRGPRRSRPSRRPWRCGRRDRCRTSSGARSSCA